MSLQAIKKKIRLSSVIINLLSHKTSFGKEELNAKCCMFEVASKIKPTQFFIYHIFCEVLGCLKEGGFGINNVSDNLNF